MRCDVKSCILADILDLVIDYRGKTPKKLGSTWAEKGIRALSAKNIKTGKIVQQETIRFVDENLYRKWMKDEIQRGDIIITSEAPFGEVFYWDSDEKIVLSQRLFALRVNPAFNAKFVYYYMITHQFQSELLGRATGTTVIGLRQPELLKCLVILPDINEQNIIAKILSSIDDKIELNNAINDNLEQQAQAIFKSWFVDFEPFGGVMPSDWEISTVSYLGNVVGGSTPSKTKEEYYTTSGIPWITPKDLSIDKSKFISKGSIDITEFGLKNSSASIMPKGTVLFSSRAPIGYIAIAKNNVTTNQGFKSIVPFENIGTAYTYFFLKHNIETVESMASGSTFKEVSASVMRTVPAIIPDEGTLSRFTTLCQPIFEQQEKLEHESKLLAQLRDTLLPRLMSSEIDVSQVEV